MIHFGHGQLAHGVFCVFWVAAGEVHILNVAHFEERDVRWGRRLEVCYGRSLCGDRKLLILEVRGSLEEACGVTKWWN